jgi:parallel beta-helix repeat protein
MARKLIFSISLILLTTFLSCTGSIGFNVKASNGYPVHNINTGMNYTTIQEAIDAAETQNGHSIFVEEGTYYDHVVVNKSISLIGQGRDSTILDGNETGIVILVTADEVAVAGFTVRNGDSGIHVGHANDSLIMENNAISNAQRGILITNSWNFTVSHNDVYNSGWYGINANASMNGLISQNDANGNYFDGIGLADSDNCTVVGNNVRNNTLFGVWVDYSSDYNSIYHNNIVSNGVQTVAGLPTHRWDNGIEGNYWSNYTGADSDHDGIGDEAHVINADNVDNYPLMGMFSSFNTSLGYQVNVISNSSIDYFEYFEPSTAIRMHVSNITANQEFGFCRIMISHGLISEPYNVTVDGAEPQYVNYTLYDDGDNRWMYFSYQYSPHDVVIASEFPSIFVLLLLAIATMLPLVAYRRKHVNRGTEKEKRALDS